MIANCLVWETIGETDLCFRGVGNVRSGKHKIQGWLGWMMMSKRGEAAVSEEFMVILPAHLVHAIIAGCNRFRGNYHFHRAPLPQV
jgi:hypothetical protein